jgi:hypothetical protein
MKIWCVQWKRRFKRTDDSPFCHFPCIFHKFHGHDDSEVKEAVNTWFASQAASFYDAGIQKLVPRYGKGLNNSGNCQKVVCGMYIKWQYKCSGNKFFFSIPHRNLLSG